MNICIINVDDKPQFIGGIKRVCVTLANKWIAMEHQVLFVCSCDNELKYDAVAGIPQVHFPNTKRIEDKENADFLKDILVDKQTDVLLNPFMDCKEVSRLCFSVCKDTKVKLIMAWHFSPTHFTDIVDNSFFVPLKLGNPLKRYLLDSLLWLKWRLYRRNQVMQSWNEYFRECIENSDKVVFLSERFIPIVEQMVGGHSDKITAINNPVIFDNKESVDYGVKEKRVLWVGRLGYDMKRVDKMLSIWKTVNKTHQDWKLIVCGSGDKNYFESLCKKNSIHNVEFTGFVDVMDYYKKASILCNTSVTEGWGLVLIEAMQYGCVPMAFDSYASVRDIITDGENGFIIPAFDEKEYACKLEMLINDSSLRYTMANHGKESIRRFSQNVIANQWINLFNSL